MITDNVFNHVQANGTNLQSNTVCLAQKASRSSNIIVLTTLCGKNLKQDTRTTNTVSEQHWLNQKSMIYHIYLNVRQVFSPEIWCWTMLRCLRFLYKAMNWTMANRIALNWTMQNQSKACITKSSCDIPPMFQNNLLAPSSKVNKSKRENRVQLMSTDTIFVWGTCPSSNFLNKHDVSDAIYVSVFRHKST
jgi:hypothetical protein